VVEEYVKLSQTGPEVLQENSCVDEYVSERGPFWTVSQLGWRVCPEVCHLAILDGWLSAHHEQKKVSFFSATRENEGKEAAMRMEDQNKYLLEPRRLPVQLQWDPQIVNSTSPRASGKLVPLLFRSWSAEM
jgi:hypothetical protein